MNQIHPKIDNKKVEGISMENNKIEDNPNNEKNDNNQYIINKLNDLTNQL